MRSTSEKSMYRPSSKKEKKIIIADKTSKVFLLLCIIVSIQFAILYEKKISVKAKDTRYTIGRVRKG